MSGYRLYQDSDIVLVLEEDGSVSVYSNVSQVLLRLSPEMLSALSKGIGKTSTDLLWPESSEKPETD